MSHDPHLNTGYRGVTYYEFVLGRYVACVVECLPAYHQEALHQDGKIDCLVLWIYIW